MGTSTDWILNTAARSREYDEKAESSLRGLSIHQLNWRPDKDTWSVAQQLHHMVLANRSYVQIMEELSSSAGPADKTYKPGFWGRFLLKAVGPEESMPAPVPKQLIPSEQPMDQAILDEFIELETRYHSALSKLQGKDMNAKFSSPFAKMIRLKLGDAVQILEQHNERHLGKAFKLLQRPDFPK